MYRQTRFMLFNVMRGKHGNAASTPGQCNAISGSPDLKYCRNHKTLCYNLHFREMARNETHTRRFLVAGRVQGVGYRNFVQQLAEELDLCGYVRNRRDGRVEVLAIGAPEELRRLRQALEKGPRMSRVAKVIEEPATLDTRYERDFTVEMTI
jgi:acylphosphatase